MPEYRGGEDTEETGQGPLGPRVGRQRTGRLCNARGRLLSLAGSPRGLDADRRLTRESKFYCLLVSSLTIFPCR